MCRADIDRDAYHAAFGEPLTTRIPDVAERLFPFERDGLLESRDSGWGLTPEGRIFMRPVAMAFDAYLEPSHQTTAPRQRFSQTV